MGSGLTFGYGILAQDPFFCIFPIGAVSGAATMRVAVGKALDKMENLAELEEIAAGLPEIDA